MKASSFDPRVVFMCICRLYHYNDPGSVYLGALYVDDGLCVFYNSYKPNCTTHYPFVTWVPERLVGELLPIPGLKEESRIVPTLSVVAMKGKHMSDNKGFGIPDLSSS